ncbi:MAG: hypothetical protein KI785_14915 [Devosiaceae bacterium]|nr:hypothetical protein [Devosiaceae bacterium MH13]
MRARLMPRLASFACLVLALLVFAMPGGALASAMPGQAPEHVASLSAAETPVVAVAETCCEAPAIDARTSAASCASDCPMVLAENGTEAGVSATEQPRWRASPAGGWIDAQRLPPPRV